MYVSENDVLVLHNVKEFFKGMAISMEDGQTPEKYHKLLKELEALEAKARKSHINTKVRATARRRKAKDFNI